MTEILKEKNKTENLPEGWKRVRLGEVLKYEQPQKYIVKNENLDNQSGIPVLTAGKSFLLGYTDERIGVYQNIPAILFDDFTTDSKYVNFPFKIKSSAIKILKTYNEDNNLFFLFHIIQKFKFHISSEHKRYWISEFSKIEVNLPPLPEQQKIAEILETVDNAIERTEKIIEKYKRIKQGLMQDLLTKGIDENGKIRDEKTHKFKNSPLGKIPEEWEVVRLINTVKKIKRGPSLSVSNYTEGIIYLTSDYLIGNGKIKWDNLKYLKENLNLKYCLLENEDIILNCVNSLEQLGKVAFFGSYNNKVIIGFNNLALSLKKEIISPLYLTYYLMTSKIQGFLRIISKPAVHQVSFGKKDLSTILIPLPPLPEQKRIASVLSQIDETIEKETAYKEKLQHLKKGLMEDLLTGKVRVKI